MNYILVLAVVGLLIALIVTLIVIFRQSSGKGQDHNLTSQVDVLQRTLEMIQRDFNDRLETNNKRMQTSVQHQLTESAKIIKDVNIRLTKLDDTNRRVVDVADELKTLQNVLQNPKQRGVFGEFYLESVLENVLAPKQYKMQYSFKNGDVVDAAVFLHDDKILPVDSKFSLENYNRMIKADTKEQRAAYMAKIRSDLKGRIDETSKYIREDENTMDFAFMFIPSEALYYDVLMGEVGVGAGSRDLLEYAYSQRRVIIVSPTSFMAYLQTVLQGLRGLQIEKQAKEIQQRVGLLGRHISSYEELMHKLGGSLSTTVNHYNNAHKELKKIDKDVVKIADTVPSVEPEVVDRPQRDLE